MEKSKISIEFEEYLKSIGGLKNGFFTDSPPIEDRHFFSIGDGWIPLVQQLIKDCIEAGWDKQICQVKGKFGGLRFYINAAETKVFAVAGYAGSVISTAGVAFVVATRKIY